MTGEQTGQKKRVTSVIILLSFELKASTSFSFMLQSNARSCTDPFLFFCFENGSFLKVFFSYSWWHWIINKVFNFFVSSQSLGRGCQTRWTRTLAWFYCSRSRRPSHASWWASVNLATYLTSTRWVINIAINTQPYCPFQLLKQWFNQNLISVVSLALTKRSW